MFFLREQTLFPPELATALEAGLSVGNDAGKKRRAAALRALWPRLARQRGQLSAGERHYSFHPEEAGAYAAYYLPANCLKSALVLEESFLLGLDPLPDPAKWLDLGTGPGTCFWGLAWWCRQRGVRASFLGWDQSREFAAIAERLAAHAPPGVSSKFIYGGHDPLELVRRERPTHLSFMNSIAEIHPAMAQREQAVGALLRALCELERADGRARFLLLVEPASRESSRELAQLKDAVQRERLGRVVLPCSDDRPCGALARSDDWCHEEVGCAFPDWLNELGAEAGLRKESLLFSYAWIRAGAGAPLLPSLDRMVSQRFERKGQVECRLCTRSGKIPARVQRSKRNAENEFFLQVARGDLWERLQLGEKGDVLSGLPFPRRHGSIFTSRA